VTNYLIR